MLEKLTKKKNRKGFTLVELIVVIAILGILMLIAVPRFAGFREQSAIKADQATAATIGKAAELYLLDSESTDVTIDNLKNAELIEGENITPQAKGAKEFELDVYTAETDNKITVSYNTNVTIGNKQYSQLYPAKDPDQTKSE